MTIFYFTATGNSLAAAKRIGGELISIPQRSPGVFKDDVIGVVFPTYGFSVPKIVRRFLEASTFEAEYIFAVATYGNICGAVAEDIRRIGRFDYVNTLLTVDNFQPIFDIARQKAKLPSKRVEEHLSAIVNDIRERKHFAPKCGVVAKFLTWMCSKIDIEPEDNPRRYFRVDESCDGCNICGMVCPTGNVEKGVFGENCVCCQACVHACPKHAIHVKGERSSERWRNPEVTLREIIEANKQERI